MAWQLSHAAPGRRLSSPHSCWPIWSGGEHTIILSVPMHRCEWRSCSHESEGANGRRNATDNVHLRWQPAEPTDVGQRARCSLAPCRQFSLESYDSQMRSQDHPVGRSRNVRAEVVGWSLLPEEKVACL